jgi:hypothetical protein
MNRMKKTIKKVVPTAAVTPPRVQAPVKLEPAKKVLKSEPVKTIAKSEPTKTPLAAAAAPITIEAKVDVGFGNRLFLRGQGGGLSWDHGIPLECVDSRTWRLIVPAKDSLQFKLLINDSVWAKGEDVVATPGKRVEVVPAF